MRAGSISFVIPMYNESRGIAAVISELTGMAERLTGDYEIIISDVASFRRIDEIDIRNKESN